MVMMHPLARYLAKHKLTQKQFAQRSGVGRPTITKVLNGSRRRFSPDAARLIEKATKGEVTLDELLFTRSPRHAA